MSSAGFMYDISSCRAQFEGPITSTALTVAETVFRVALTFIPLASLSKFRSRKVLEKIEKMRQAGRGKDMDLDGKARRAITYLKRARKITRILLLIPGVVVAFTLLAGIERTPLTGRWRFILLSPWEEDDIAFQLAGTGWYAAVGEILASGGDTPKLIDPSDWRYRWVQQTLRRLEGVIPVLQAEKELRPDWIEGATEVPLPPPSDYPLRPRLRESDYIGRMAEATNLRSAEEVVLGPPYSLLVVDRPESSNAFSYGFGPDGAAGIVVYSGFLDDIMAKCPAESVVSPELTSTEEVSWWSAIFGGLLNAQPLPSRPTPSEEQTSELAILLAHEVAHLLLSHHIETLSIGSIVGPSLVTITTDVIRTFMFPFTMLFGPFINDAISGVWKTSSVEFAKFSGICTSHEQEIEADIVSARLLAHAGFDPRHAVRFWENRSESAHNAECAHAPKDEVVEERTGIGKVLPHRWAGSAHPLNVERVRKLKQELERWEEERRRAREASAAPAPGWRRPWALLL
ncbi:peptidase family M48-domain-containing protein [Fomitopsis serialis]|uniref:peptidase family M48-domain-containing protein n=1 Tax=Fomitopsis serialis TaxID=139415 RepID=UPI0020089E18|nr:peptidase family M48-domain-containing protein [Neoantrodia serialis]KAH9917032.1 peptidase family M48-domain-containing protein [Neoantrodia serialis]